MLRLEAEAVTVEPHGRGMPDAPRLVGGNGPVMQVRLTSTTGSGGTATSWCCSGTPHRAILFPEACQLGINLGNVG